MTREEKIQKVLSYLSIPYEHQVITATQMEEQGINLGNYTDDIGHADDFLFMITVKYPNITVKNSHNKSKFLGDVYATFYVQNAYKDGKFLINIALASVSRSVFHIEDFGTSINNSYVASHIVMQPISASTSILAKVLGTNVETQSVCYGSSPLATLTYYLNPENLNHVLINHKRFFEWESLEGIPYRKISVNYFLESVRSGETLLSDIIDDLNLINEPVFFSRIMFERIPEINSEDKILPVIFDRELFNFLYKLLPGNYSMMGPMSFNSHKFLYTNVKVGDFNLSRFEEAWNRANRFCENFSLSFKGEKIVPKLVTSLEQTKEIYIGRGCNIESLQEEVANRLFAYTPNYIVHLHVSFTTMIKVLSYLMYNYKPGTYV